MKIEVTQDVIEDLLPVYLSGDVSKDTKALVEEYLRQDPQMRARLEQAKTAFPPAAPDPAIDMEKRALAATQKLFEHRFTLCIWAYAVSFAVFSFRFKNNHIDWLLYRDWPAVSFVLLGVAAVLWVLFFVKCRQLLATGLVPPAKHSIPRWLLGGAVASIPFSVVLSAHTGWELVRDLMPVGALTALAIGHALGARLPRNS